MQLEAAKEKKPDAAKDKKEAPKKDAAAPKEAKK